jgi:hypothetical protein
MLISLTISPSQICQDITIDVSLNGHVLSTTTCGQEWVFEHELAENDISQDHVLSVSMSGKNETHTVVGPDNDILSDCTVQITNINFDGIDVTDIYAQGRVCYTHDFNGTQPQIHDEFYGILGCNGTVNIEFYTPIHIWLLENC